MAFFSANSVFDVNDIRDLSGPLLKIKTTTGFAISDTFDQKALLVGSLTLGQSGTISGTVTALTRYSYDYNSEYFSLTGISANINNNYDVNGYKVDGVTVGRNSTTGEMAYLLRGSDVLYGSYYGDNLAGYAGNDLVHALDGNDTVMGWSGNDTVYGEDGADLIYGDNDLNTDSNAYAGNDKLYGGAGDDTLFGCGGNDVLDAGSGLNTLAGGVGNDIYYVYNSSDRVQEAANAGVDTVFSSVSFGLGSFSEVENLTLTGSEDGTNAFGNGLQNVITGNSGANYLDGAANSNIKLGDRLVGGNGDDAYAINSAKDIVVEKLNEGIDTIVLDRLAEAPVGQIAYSIANLANVENINYWGDQGAVLTGNSLNNQIWVIGDGPATVSGGLGKDYLIGGINDDVLDGGLDNDKLLGGSGDDKFVMNTKNFDVILDFKGESLTDSDKLYFNPAKFTRLKTGITFDEVETYEDLLASTEAIVFLKDFDFVYYNATGKAGGAVAICQLVGVPSMSQSDIVTSLAA